jgi:CheY-like chemotaxis protein
MRGIERDRLGDLEKDNTGVDTDENVASTRTTIIGMSANADRTACLAAGMDDFIPKPFGVKDLVTSYMKVRGRLGRL